MDHTGHLFRRCVQCPPTTPACPSCASDETCTLIAQSCGSCASTICTKSPDATPAKHSTPAGAIAGGIIGGIIVIALVVFLVWRFVIRDRRKAWEAQTWTDESTNGVEKHDQPGLQRSGTQRTARSVHSIASTVFTRASNVIQIAYIPGVTNRSPPDTPGLLVPPVPPLPLATVNSHSSASTPAYEQDQHFFLPGDFRDSTWSGYSDMTRASISPSLARSSVATTIYRDNAIVSPMPAQQALRGKAAVVSVKSGNTTPTSDGGQFGETTPPLPANAKAIASSNTPVIGRNLQARPIQVRKTSPANNVPTFSNLQARAKQEKITPLTRLDSASEGSSDEETTKAEQRRSLVNQGNSRHSIPATVIEDSPTDGTSSSVNRHSVRNSTAGPSHRHKKSGSGGLQSLIEEAMNRASRVPTHVGLGAITDSAAKPRTRDGPFSDVHEVKENI